MGLSSVVLVSHDALHGIEEDKNFGSNLTRAVITGANSGGRIKPGVCAGGSSGSFGDAAKYVATYSSNDTGLVLVDGGGASRLSHEESSYLLAALSRFRRKKAKK